MMNAGDTSKVPGTVTEQADGSLERENAPTAFIEDPLWYKDAVIYQVHVKSYFDADNDGIGDFAGLIEKLDYISSLGVNTIWILPFYPSPRRDDGYDISEYYGVSPDYGTMEDAQRFFSEAHKRGLRVITELVINHTSDQHEWFQRARNAPIGSPERDFYVWSDTDQKYDGTRIIFLDTETSNWTWDPVAGQYFWHRFYSHQPDLNFDNPAVLEEVLNVMRYWLDLGVDGLRLDAIPYLVEREGTNNENLDETHVVLKKIRAVIDEQYPDRMLLAEANQWPEDTRPYFGDGDECQMAFHFPLMPRMYMSLAQEDRFPITDILRQTPEIPADCQWAIFLRNHDELTLEMVTDKERDYLWEHYASDKRARINLGIRRRLAPLMERDRRRVELLNSLLLSMPGTPVVYYGDEIGMGDNIHLGDRDGVRTPMQWSMDRNGGFSRADPASLVLPPIMDPLYGFQTINVEAQARDPHSQLNWMRRMLTVRKQQKAFGRGALKLLYPTNRRILAYLREYTNEAGELETIMCVANVSRSAQAVELDLSAYAGRVPVEMIGGSTFPPIGQLTYLLTLPPYGFYWFMLASEAHMPSWHTPAPEPMPDMVTLVIKRRIEEILNEPSRALLENEALPLYLPKRRWFGSKDEKITRTHLAYAVRLAGDPVTATHAPMLLSEVEVHNARGVERYVLPLGYIGEENHSALAQQLSMTRMRRGRQVGHLTDAFAVCEFVFLIIESMKTSCALPIDGGAIRFIPTSKMEALELSRDDEVRYLSAEQSNSSVIVGDEVVLKIIRKVEAGVHPEAEIGRYLTERGFQNIAPLLGEVTRFDEEGTPHVLMVAQGYVDNQGDAWQWTLNTLERAIRDASTGGMSDMENEHSAMKSLNAFAAILGQRLGEMHLALAAPSDDPAFAPEVADGDTVTHWAGMVRARIEEALDILATHKESASQEDQALAEALLLRHDELLASAEGFASRITGSLCTRIHGDLHLGQVLVSHDDAYLIDFEGEPARPLAERRAKHSPLKDVAGLVRSFDYAAAMALDNAKSADATEETDRISHQIVDEYRANVTNIFLDAYRSATADLAHRWQHDDGELAALDLFTLEKAAYEVAYEAANRPSWLGVPLRGLATITDKLTAGGQHD
ncbi:maltose alpha-D-glucosyltransferase [Phytohalomonas tamaricis]|uniref:maltose alpha-D-glucosyltransferase n=1 Tax=Phytohalomonas tamaricis TaxID=2081032 RepID=UPI0021D46546|nr:maltose alpha-D-glucosyltransferase [Phytohalomonas tamaricis]